MHSILLIIGLGNPGSQYISTRHNIGFEVINNLSARWEVTLKKKFDGLFGEVDAYGKRVALLKPQTYMNLSGRSVVHACSFFKIPHDKFLIVNDDLDLPKGQIRFRGAGGDGGHKGLQSVIEMVGSEKFPRLRIGIGRSENQNAEHYVLSPMGENDKRFYKQIVTLAADAAECWVKHGLSVAMNQFNRKDF